MVSRYFLEIAYEGTNFHGWQIQENAHSVQAELNSALEKVLKLPQLETMGCGRTDTGVHAKQFFVHFDAPEITDPSKVVFQLNGILPNSVAAHRLVQVGAEAHARFDATARAYVYEIHTRKNPFLQNRSMFLPQKLNLERMNEAAQLLCETTDFSSFAKAHGQTHTNNCLVSEAWWQGNEYQFTFTICADRFLRNMVRAIVGTLLELGMGKIDIDAFATIIAAKDRSKAGFSVDACGLYLTRVIYPYLEGTAE